MMEGWAKGKYPVKEEILKELPSDVLNAKVSAEDLLKFSPVLRKLCWNYFCNSFASRAGTTEASAEKAAIS